MRAQPRPAAFRRLAALAMVAVMGAPLAAATELRQVRLSEGSDHTRAVFEISGPIQYKVFELADPPRVVIDIPKARLGRQFDAPRALGVVQGLRTGNPEAGTLRVVIDLGARARPRSFVLSPSNRAGYRLVVDLHPAGAAVAARRPPVPAPAEARDVVVAIDAGHGGVDPGAIGPGGTREKDVTLAIARRLAAAIDAEPGMSAVLLRDGDDFIPLRQRYERAREARADLFISIHADAIASGRAAGSSVYMLSTRGASSEAARWLADRENAADLVGGVSLTDKEGTLAAVLLDLSQGATLQASDQVANQVLRSLSRFGRVHKQEVQRANFVVLRSPDVPSILVETAFISNAEEERRLRDPQHQQRLADAIVDGVRNHFHAAPPPGTWIAANPRPPREHIVARGETLSLIAQRHGVSVASLKRENRLRDDALRVGAVLRIPG